jgi:NADH-quinone oxidoreductase subunit H
MTVISKGWDRLTLPGKIVFTAVPLLIALTVGLVAAIVLLGPTIVDILANNLPIVRFVVAVTIILLMTVPTAFLIIYMEMKIIALMNLRIGPDRVGPFGSLLSVVHGLKVLMKEDFTPTGADTTVFMTLLVIPFAPGIVGQDLNLGLLYFFAIGGLGVVGLLMGGWSSYNKYSLLGGLRSAAQVVSYEIPLTLSVVGLILLAGTMSLHQIVENQSGWFTDWYVWQQPLGALIFFIAATAEANRTPFDLTEADSEIVAGFATEYSGMRFGFFFFAEYVNVFIISALTVTLFFGGWNAPFPWPDAWRLGLDIDPGSLGLGLLFVIGLVPLVLTIVFALPFYLASSRIKGWQALVAGFILANLFLGAVFFAEYVNVFIMSALTVTLFFGGWNAPFPWPFETSVAFDPASLGIGLLILIAVVPVVLTLLFAAPFWIASSRIKTWQALAIGFVLANLFIVGLLVAWAYVELDWVAGILWFMLKTYVFVFTFVWMRGTLPRVRIDQLMDFAWKWLLPASLLNLFVTAAAIVVLSQLDPSGSLVPGATQPVSTP